MSRAGGAVPGGAGLLVVGGGPAGLAAAIAAARRGVPVTLCEASRCGRDRVCGEFLSPEVAADLEALGCGDWIERLEPARVGEVVLFGPRGARLSVPLPGAGAWALTRNALETFLAARAREAGVRLREHTSVRRLAALAGGGWRWEAAAASGAAAALVCAIGKRSSLDAQLALPRASRPGVFGAVKAYFDVPAREVLEGGVELHLLRGGGYVGLNPVEGGRLALCALVEGDPTRDWAAIAAHLCETSGELARRIERAGSPSGAVRGLGRFGFGPQRLHRRVERSVALLCGDAARMLPPFTGDGIAAALSSGRLAAWAALEPDPIAAYERAYRAELAPRQRVAGLLHGALLRPGVFSMLAPVLGRAPRATRLLYAWTRGASQSTTSSR